MKTMNEEKETIDPEQYVGKLIVYQFNQENNLTLIAADVIAYYADMDTFEMNIYKPDGSIEHRFNRVDQLKIEGIIGRAKHMVAIARKVPFTLELVNPWCDFIAVGGQR